MKIRYLFFPNAYRKKACFHVWSHGNCHNDISHVTANLCTCAVHLDFCMSIVISNKSAMFFQLLKVLSPSNSLSVSWLVWVISKNHQTNIDLEILIRSRVSLCFQNSYLNISNGILHHFIGKKSLQYCEGWSRLNLFFTVCSRTFGKFSDAGDRWSLTKTLFNIYSNTHPLSSHHMFAMHDGTMFGF